MGRGAESLRQVVLVKGSMGKGPVSLRLAVVWERGQGARRRREEVVGKRCKQNISKEAAVLGNSARLCNAK